MNKLIKRNIVACYISDVVLGTYFQLPIWIVYQATFLDFADIAFYAGLALIVEVVAQLPTGAFADLYGRRFALSLGNLFMALPMFLIAFFPKPEIMIAYACMWGLGRAFCMGTSKPILYETLARYGKTDLYPKLLSRSVMFFQFSAAISIASGGYLYGYDEKLPYIASGIASLIGVFTSLTFIEQRENKSVFRIKQFVQTAQNGFREIFKSSYITRLTVLYALALGISQANQQFFVQPYMLELGMSNVLRSWASMIIKIGIALLGAKLMGMTKFIKSDYFLLVIPVLMIVSLIPAGFVSLPVAYLLFIGIAFCSGNTDLFLSPEINKCLTTSVRSTAISIQRMLASTVAATVQWLSIVLIAQSSVGMYYSYVGVFSLLVILPLAYTLLIQKRTTSYPAYTR